MKRIFIGLVIFLAVAVAGVYGWRQYLISDAHQLLLSDLADPDAALFRNVSYVGEWSGRGVVCGEVNIKNRMGGYIGYRRYFVWPEVVGVKKADYQIEGNRIVSDRIYKICDDFRYADNRWWRISW